MELLNLDWLGIVFAALAYYLLGAFWFTPLFGRAYDRALGFERGSSRFPASYYVVPFLSALAVSLSIAILGELGDVRTTSDAFEVGALVGVGVALPISINNAWTPVNAKPLAFGLVTGGYHLVGAVLVSLMVYLL